MRVVAIYSHKGGREVMEEQHSSELAEIYSAIESVDAHQHKTKVSEEKTSAGEVFYSPGGLNKEFKRILYPLGCDLSKSLEIILLNIMHLDTRLPPKREQNHIGRWIL